MIRHADSLILVWKLAELEARHAHVGEITVPHFFLGLLKAVDIHVKRLAESWEAECRDSVERISGDIAFVGSVFAKSAIETTPMRRRLRQRLTKGSADEEDPLRRSADSREVFRAAESMDETVRPAHLLVAILDAVVPEIVAVLRDSGVDAQVLYRNAKLASTAPIEKCDEPVRRQKVRKTTFLTSVGRDLTQLGKEGKLEPIIGRKDEIRQLAQILLQSRKNNIILTGEAGVGKTGIVEGLAQRIATGEVAEEFRSIRIIEIPMSSIVAGTTFRGDFEARFEAIIKEAAADSNLILFIDEIHLLMGAGQSAGGAMDAANILKPALARGEIRIIGATTTAEYRRFIAKDPALERRFQTLHVAEPSRTQSLEILAGLQARLEKHHSVTIGTDALSAAVDLSTRYIPDRRLPDKALDLIDQACARARLQSLTSIRNPTRPHIDRSHIAAVVSQLCGVPVSKLTVAEKEKFLRMEEHLRQRVKGQDEALSSISDAIRIAKSGLRNASKPIGVFLLAGPTGSGKTEVAKAVAEFLFGDETNMVRLDMSEFMEEHSVSKLIGSPPGYVGHEEGGQLTERIRDNPYTVLLLDEIEKAHPKLLDIFLQIFDEGVLTDAKGRKCDFCETVIFLTSNLGAADAPARRVGFRNDEQEPLANNRLDAVRDAFRPELINRLSEIIVFRPLDNAAVRQIIDKFVDRLNERLRKERVTISLDDSAFEFLMQQGFSDRYGARAMERSIDTLVSKPLAKALLNGAIPPGGTVTVSASAGRIVLSAAPNQ